MNATDVGRGALWLLWKSLSLPVFILLATLESVVSFVLGSLALLGVLTALFFKLIGAPHFPFVTMLASSLGLGLLRIGCRALLRTFIG
jgi:hypothetical protein